MLVLVFSFSFASKKLFITSTPLVDKIDATALVFGYFAHLLELEDCRNNKVL